MIKNDISIVNKPVNDLIPYINNARTHSEDQINQIAASIKEFGFTNPVLIDGENGIIAGHGRVLASKKLNIDKVPTIELSHLTETQKKAYILADNKLALNAGWDDDLLSLELSGLDEVGFDFSVAGFGQEEIKDILGSDVACVDMPELGSGDKEPFQQITFTLHDTQADIVKEALRLSSGMGKYINAINQNSNGNALARICETFITQNDRR